VRCDCVGRAVEIRFAAAIWPVALWVFASTMPLSFPVCGFTEFFVVARGGLSPRSRFYLFSLPLMVG
jgi:hypothetical protein